MRNLLRGVSLLLILAMAAGAVGAQDAEGMFGAVSGTVSYRPRIALPDDAEILVELSDVSWMDAPAIVIASQRIITNGRQVPIQYALDYDGVGIAENSTIIVSAKIFIGGELRWINDVAYPVITNGRWEADINVVQVAAPAEATEPVETSPFGHVSGTVTYLPRIGLPDDAVVTVELLDVSWMDVPAVVMASQRIVTSGRQVPIRYSLSYDRASISERNTYTVRATIRLGDQLIWTSDTANPVITNGVFDVQVMLVQVGA